MKHTALLLAAATAALTACNKGNSPDLQGGEAIIVKACIDIPTKSNPIGDAEAQKGFNTGDRIELVKSTSGISAVYVLEDDNSWAPEGKKYLTWDNGKTSFEASYPAGYKFISDQSDDAGLCASDYMTATRTDLSDDGSHEVSLEFTRGNSLVTFRIAGYKDQFSEGEDFISDFKAYLPQDAVSDKPAEIIPYMRNAQGVHQLKGAEGSIGCTYTAIGYPESSSFDQSSHKFAELTVKTADGSVKTLTVMGIPHHEAGKAYAYNLIIGKDKAMIAGVTVNDWITGDEFDNGFEAL